jgi:hypothetical protein
MSRFNFWEFIGVDKPERGDNNMLRTRSSKDTQDRLQQMHDAVAKKAYELYEQRGCRHGRDQQDWLEAERLVRRGMRQR